MTKPPKEPNFDEHFDQAIKGWREKHKLREDEAVLLMVELFRIHQQHWDELRRREMPSFQQYSTDVLTLTEAAKIFQKQSVTLIESLKLQPPSQRMMKVTRTAAVFAALACLLAGYLIGKAWQ
jgi:hypothetical protein